MSFLARRLEAFADMVGEWRNEGLVESEVVSVGVDLHENAGSCGWPCRHAPAQVCSAV